MLNHFRTLLLNIDDNSNPEEHVAPKYKAKKLLPSLQSIYDSLFGISASREQKLDLVQSYLNLLDSLNLNSEVLAYDNRVSYNLKNKDNFNTSINLTDVITQLERLNPFYILSQIGKTSIEKYQILWDFSKNDIVRLAAVLFAYMIKLNEL